jgi:hypothetical protein
VEKVAEDGCGNNPPLGSPVKWKDPPSSEANESGEGYRGQSRIQQGIIRNYPEYIDDREEQLGNEQTAYIIPEGVDPRYQATDHIHREPEEWNPNEIHVVYPDPQYWPYGPAPCGKDIARDMFMSALFTSPAYVDPESPPTPIAAILPGHGIVVIGPDRETTNNVILNHMTLRKPIGV